MKPNIKKKKKSQLSRLRNQPKRKSNKHFSLNKFLGEKSKLMTHQKKREHTQDCIADLILLLYQTQINYFDEPKFFPFSVSGKLQTFNLYFSKLQLKPISQSQPCFFHSFYSPTLLNQVI